MNSSSGAVACWYGEQKTIPKRRFRRRVVLRRPLLGAHPRGCPSTRPRPARGFQRAEVDRENRLPVALHAPRPAALGGRLSADAAVARRRGLRGDGPRFARDFAAFARQSLGAFGGHTRLSHARLDPRAAIGAATPGTSARRARRCTPPWTPWGTCSPCSSVRPPSRSEPGWASWQ